MIVRNELDANKGDQNFLNKIVFSKTVKVGVYYFAPTYNGRGKP